MSKLVNWDGRKVHPSTQQRVTDEQKFTHFIDARGKKYARVRFGDEGRDGNRCPDCATKLGWIHDDGCDWEVCPKCGGQLLSCDCGFPKKCSVKKL